MPRINLLRETEGEESKKPKKTPKPKGKMEMTSPIKESPPPKKPKAPSGFSLWLKSLFKKKEPTAEIKSQRIISEPPKPKPVRGERETSVYTGKAEDIFAGEKPLVPPSEQEARPSASEKKLEDKIRIPEPEKGKMEIVTETKQPPPPKPEKTGKKTPQVEKAKKKESAEERPFLVNLLPEELAGKIDMKAKLLILGLTFLIAAAGVGLIYLGLNIYQSRVLDKIKEIQSKRAVIDQEIESLKDTQKKALALKKRTAGIKNLLNYHLYWTNFFENLEKYTIDNVYYESLAADKEGTVTLVAQANDFTSMARQIVAFQNSITEGFLTDVVATAGIKSKETETISGSGSPETVRFPITLVLSPDIFYKTSLEMK